MEVSLEEAYAEACRALGAAAVREVFLTAELERMRALIAQQNVDSLQGAS